MLIKVAKTIVDGMRQGLTNGELDAAITAALAARGKTTAETMAKDAEAVRNEYVQHQWDVEDLTGPAAAKAPTAPKAAKKAKAAPKKKAAAKKAPKAKAAKKPGVGARQVALILAGKTNEQVLAAVRKEFPGAATTAACVAWYRSKVHTGALGKDKAAELKRIEAKGAKQ